MPVISAGRDAKEDLLITMEKSPKLNLEVESTVETLYGAQIRRLVHESLETLGLSGVSVSVKDRGALDWVIQARVEAAARRLLPTLTKEVLPQQRGGRDFSVQRDRMRRSRLYLPGDQPDLMSNAGLFEPDAVILDLEDAVAPAAKDAARLLVRNALIAIDFGLSERMVRINQLPKGLEDLPFIVPHGVHTILIPKVEQAEDIHAVAKKIKELTEEQIFLMPILESAKGIENAFAIASADPTVVALAFGAEDFTKDICAARTEQGAESFVARSRVVLAARAAGIQPIDTVYSDVANEAGLLSSTKEAIALGFDGKGCIHPRQIQVIHQAFRPNDKEIAYAYRVKCAMDQAGDGVISLGSKMIDPPVVARAMRTLKLAEFYGINPAEVN